MEDIRTYLDGTGGKYHKGETHPFAAFTGLSLILLGVFWVVTGGWFLLKYGVAFVDVSGALKIDAPSSGTCWVLASYRLLQGAVLIGLGLVAWDQRQVFVWAAWVLLPLYLWLWSAPFLAMDPQFRAQEFGLENMTSHPIGFLVVASLLLPPILLLGSLGMGYLFRPSDRDPSAPILFLGIGLVVGGAWMFQSEVPRPVVATAAYFGISPLDDPGSGLGVAKLVAFTREELMCHENMDGLKTGLAQLEETGQKVLYSAYDDRPGGERLVRRIQQLGAVPENMACPSGGYYRVLREVGTWRCSVHGDRIPPEDRQVAGLDNSDPVPVSDFRPPPTPSPTYESDFR